MERSERQFTDAVQRESGRLRSFIRARLPDDADVEDLLQDIVSDLLEHNALIEPVRQVGAWLFRVARNRIIDRYRRRTPPTLRIETGDAEAPPGGVLEDWLPSPDEGPEAAYARGILLDELAAALDELAPEQRAVFVAHELEGRSFRELSEQWGESMNTLLSRKRYAVHKLRDRLRAIYNEYVTG